MQVKRNRRTVEGEERMSRLKDYVIHHSSCSMPRCEYVENGIEIDCDTCQEKMLEKHDAKVRAEGESIGITRVLDILEHLDTQMLQMVKDALYEQDYNELKEQK